MSVKASPLVAHVACSAPSSRLERDQSSSPHFLLVASPRSYQSPQGSDPGACGQLPHLPARAKSSRRKSVAPVRVWESVPPAPRIVLSDLREGASRLESKKANLRGQESLQRPFASAVNCLSCTACVCRLAFTSGQDSSKAQGKSEAKEGTPPHGISAIKVLEKCAYKIQCNCSWSDKRSCASPPKAQLRCAPQRKCAARVLTVGPPCLAGCSRSSHPTNCLAVD